MGRLTAARSIPLVFLLALGLALAGASSAAAITSIKLSQIGHSDLAARGLDGQTKPRGQNGDVATLGNAAFVAGGALFHGAQSTPGRICTDYGGVKVVDLSNPAAPVVKFQIPIADTSGVLTGPKGNPRRNQTLTNVSTSVSSIDALQFPDGKKVLAIATQRCEPSFFGGASIQFWDVSNLSNPTQLGSYATGTTAGIIEDVNMFTRADKPGKVFAVTTLPFTGSNGEFRLLDVTSPAAPAEIGKFPNTSVGASNNGCRTFAGARGAAPTPDGKRAIFSLYDGWPPPSAPAALDPRADFGSPNSAALFNLDLDNLPVYSNSPNVPKTFTPNPPVWGYPPGQDGGQLLDNSGPAPEGNAADVQPYTGPSSQLLSFVSEDDVDPANTQVSVDSPAGLAGSQRGCFSAITKRPYLLPGQQVAGNTVYVGRACPASNFNRTTLRAADPLLANPAGKIAVFESGGSQFDGCSFAEKVARLGAAGATAVIGSLGADFLNEFIPGPAGGINPVPAVGAQLTTYNKIANYVPNRVLSGVTFPTTTYSRSTATNVTVKPFAVALGCASPITVDACDAATNTTPITISAVNHGLVTGDRVAISGVQGNTAANGTFTVTVLNANQFTIPVTGSAPWTGGGTVQACAPSGPCAATPARTDFSRFRSVADATDPVASGQVLPASRFAVMPGQAYKAGAYAEVQSYTAGAFRAEVEFFDAGGVSLQVNQLTPAAGLTAVTPRTRYEQTLTAPVGAATAGVKFEWTGVGNNGTAFVDTFSFSPDNAQATIKDNPGGAAGAPEWGAQRIIDFSQSTPTEIGNYRSPTSKVWPPPNDGIYAPRQARMFGTDVAFTTWLSDGVRALDVSDPASPKELGSFIPPAVADPSPGAGAGISNLDIGDPNNLMRGASWPNRPLATGVGVIPIDAKNAELVVSDINGGLYVLLAQVDPPPPNPGGGQPPAGNGLPAPGLTIPADLFAPGVSGFGLTTNPFVVGGRTPTFGSAAAKRSKRHKKGTTFRYTLSEAATVRIVIARGRTGRRKGKRCVAPTRKLRKAKKCIRLSVRGTLTRTSRKGANSVGFSGRIGSKRLSPGGYQATLTATDAAKNTSKPKTITFTIVKR